MSYTTPPGRAAAVDEAVEALRASRQAVLTTHLNADGDGVGSEVALATWLRANGNRAVIINPTPFPELYAFLLDDDSEAWVLPAGSERAREACAGADLAVVLDTGEIPRIGRVRPMIRDLRTVVVDHHPVGDRPIPGVSFRDMAACATGELVYDILLAAGGPWPAAVVHGLYVAVLTDTGSFRFSNTTPASHRVAAELIERGADAEVLYRRVYGASPLRRLRLLSAALETLDADVESGVSWMIIPEDAYQSLNASADDIEGFVDFPRSLDGTEVGLLFRKTSRGTKVSLRSNGAVDVNSLARRFGGGGHVRASGALLDLPMNEAVPLVVAAASAAAREATDPQVPRDKHIAKIGAARR